jgi:hypothetical protein
MGPDGAARDGSHRAMEVTRPGHSNQACLTFDQEWSDIPAPPAAQPNNGRTKLVEPIKPEHRRARQAWKLRSLRISAETGRSTGYLWHYGHFIHDLIMPLADWIVAHDIDPQSIDLFIEDTPDQSVGPYVDLIQTLLGVPATLLTASEFDDLEGADLPLQAYLFGPYQSSSLENLQRIVLPRFDLRAVGAMPPEVILIERGHRPSGFENNKAIPERSRKSGKQRRTIVNHAELSAALKKRYGQRFRGVVLENLPVAEQLMLFHHARLVIGQHGGGLNNLIWMSGNDGTVVELAPTAIKTFQNLCLAKGLTYRTLGPASRSRPRIEPAELLHLIETLGW